MPSFKLCTGVDDDDDDMPGIFTVMKIGYTFDGKFDPQHIDFKYCCGKMHIHLGYIIYNLVYVVIMASSKKNGEEAVEQQFEELSTLFDVITASTGLVLNAWACFCFYVEYKYLQGRYKSEII
uniref:Uncharacterized protein n=1 Tax=Panagrolaimus sp. ES5 TaxID=591445 RepID=A0AC34FYN2_9BILA